ncbi:GNAT family N-acetyltransferase [Thiocapsa imhoffii]|uniref:GNAT family N-acetyltransferase n=1 Tax=Thiocapsa imhoffii TaxID=382777 RepID=A0A9X1B961_9GAMM|nr:bifunctional acetate--CoA ligase family protein/GNAT family N-acetyltransferase [Thiocapsa imhoffii]MBK1644735.1 GNAT family N-acetyltransferase [Thiocapsa imhoffii]
MRVSDIEQLFTPSTVAVFGASDSQGSIGGMVFRNLLEGQFQGNAYPINPKYDEVAGQPCYRDLSHLDKHVDLALIATPADRVAGILEQCGGYGVKVAVVHSAGFGEYGERGFTLQERMVEAARTNRIRVLGPNCIGAMRPQHRLNASVGQDLPRPGNIALVSQSGAICTAMIDWSERRGIGFSAVVSLGAAADVDFGDVLDYLALDPQTKCILLYVEGIRNARHFMSGLRAAARLKPVVVVKAGRYAARSRSLKSHTGAYVGSADVFRAVTERAGVVQVGQLDQLFAAAQVFGTERRLAGDRIAIITNGGGPGVLAADRALALGLQLAEISDSTRKTLEQALPDYWSHGNPIDIIGDAPPERYRAVLDACLADPQVDGVLCVLAPLVFGDPVATAEQVVAAAKESRKPVLACWMGGKRVAEAQELLAAFDVPHFDSPEVAVDAFSYLANYQRNQKLLMQSPGPLSHEDAPDIEGARLIIEGVMGEGRKVLGTIEAKAILSAFRIPTTQAVLTRTPNEALMAAQALGFPVVMKINSPDLQHKSDVDGVRLNINDAQSVRRTYTEIIERAARLRPEARLEGITVEHMASMRAARELMISVSRDPIFGPVISFGAGGTKVEMLEDRALGLPPLNAFIIRTMIDHTRVVRLMGAFQHMPPMNRAALARILQRVSEMVCELPEIISMDINPLIGTDRDVTAVDARIMVDYRPPQQTTYGHMAIHPYPSHLIERVQLPDGKDLVIRPIRPEDAEMEQNFVRGLSEQTKYFRFMQAIKELTPEMLVRFTQIDYDREMALIGVVELEGREIEVGVARYMARPGGEACEFAIVVSDTWRNLGIGARLMRSLMQNARSRGFRVMDGEVLTANNRMLALVKSLGFRIESDPHDMAIKWVTKVL